MIEIGYSLRSLEGRSGDRAVVVNRKGGVLICAIDGLGHGDAAAEAADAAARSVETSAGEPLEEIIANCHEALIKTRGAVLTLVDFDTEARRLEWVGVGNVEARLLPFGAPPVPGQGAAATLFGGVLGHNLPPIRSSGHDVSVGDLLVMATDGVRADYATDLVLSGSPKAIADRVLDRSARSDDDALAVVARFLGGWR